MEIELYASTIRLKKGLIIKGAYLRQLRARSHFACSLHLWYNFNFCSCKALIVELSGAYYESELV